MEEVKLLDVWMQDRISAPTPCRRPLQHPLQTHLGPLSLPYPVQPPHQQRPESRIQSKPAQGQCDTGVFVYINIVQQLCDLTLLLFCPFSLSQCSSRVSSLVAPVGNHLTHQPGLSTSFTARHVPAHGSDSESPGGRFPPSGTGRFCSAWSGFFGWKSAGHAGASDLSPDQDAGVDGSQGHFTGNQIKSGVCFSSFCICISNYFCVFLNRRWFLCH